MGIKGLWNILEPLARNISLTEMSVREGFEENRHGTGVVVIGVDAGTWMYSSQAVLAGNSHAQAGQNPELQTLFFRLAWLSRSAVSAVFVFDGPDCPARQRNTKVRGAPHWTVERFQELITAFGFHFHMAPGEADAELAYLNRVQAIDAILTTDCDVFLFGGTQVIRSPQDAHDLDKVTVFTETAFEAENNSLFSTAGFVFLAVVSGNDYDTTGLQGCGITITSALASTALSDSLYNAGRNLVGQELSEFFVTWRNDLRNELANDFSGKIGRKYPAIAAHVSDNFPDPDILRLYCHPLTSSSNGELIAFPQRDWLVSSVPNTSHLASLCTRLFDWGPKIMERFKSNVWDGYFIRKLVENRRTGRRFSLGPAGPLNPTAIGNVTRVKNCLNSSSAFPFYRVIFFLPSLKHEAIAGVLEFEPRTRIQRVESTHFMFVWVPAPILRATQRDEVLEYHDRRSDVAIPYPMEAYIPVLESDFEDMIPSS